MKITANIDIAVLGKEANTSTAGGGRGVGEGGGGGGEPEERATPRYFSRDRKLGNISV